MLDFYLLADDQKALNFPEEAGAKMVGYIDDQTFERLKVKKVIPERFNYYSDFRWDRSLIQQIKENIPEKWLNDIDIKPLKIYRYFR
jgi:transposase